MEDIGEGLSPAIKKKSNLFFEAAYKYATTTLRIVKHRKENMAKPGGLKRTKLLAILLR